MIAYFPTAYDDELLYSQLARYYTKTGYLAYTYAAEELFLSKTVRPDMEFVNAYTPAAVEAITRNMPMEQVVAKHTMFPYYGRFLPKERREKAFRALVDMAGNYHNLLPIPRERAIPTDICATALFVQLMTENSTEKHTGIEYTR